MNDGQRAALMMVRLGLVVVVGLLVLVGLIAKSSGTASIGGVLALLSSLALIDSFTHRRKASAGLPPLLCMGVSIFGGGVGLALHWTTVAVLFVVTFVVSVAQMVWNWPKSQKRMRAEIDEAIRQQSAFPSKGA